MRIESPSSNLSYMPTCFLYQLCWAQRPAITLIEDSQINLHEPLSAEIKNGEILIITGWEKIMKAINLRHEYLPVSIKYLK